MKKIMFNDRYDLTQAVIEGRKTQTRRIVPQSVIEKYSMMEDPTIIDDARYDVGEIVAVAQSYKDCGGLMADGTPRWDYISRQVGCKTAGWDNKMFVRADLMPYKIRITDVRVERLQDISDEDCLKEGIETFYYRNCKFPSDGYTFDGGKSHFNTPREAFAHLIDKVSKKGTWESNPFVWVYDFELVK